MDKNPLFSKLTSNVPGIIFQFKLTPDGKASIPFANERILDIFGIQQEEVLYDASPIFECVHPDDIEHLRASIESSKASYSDWEYEFRIRNRMGKLRWVSGVARPEILKDKSIIWHGYLLDVTERKQFEQANQETREKYQGYFENAQDALFVVDRMGNYLEANPAASALTGYSFDELLSMKVPDLVDPDFNEADKKTLDRSFIDGSVNEDIMIRRKDGQSIWVHLVTSKINDNVVIAFCHDITQRKLHEKLLNLQLTFQRLIASISSGFVNATNSTFNSAVNYTLEQAGKFFEAQRCYIFLFSDDLTLVSNTNEWCSDGVSSQIEQLQSIPFEAASWFSSMIRNKEVVNISDLKSEKRLSSYEYELLVDQGIKSLLAIPMINNGILIGFFGLDRVNETRGWDDQQITQFNLVGEILSSAFSKSKAETALRASENRYRLLAENARDVIYRLSLHPEKKYEYVSPSSVNLTGYSPEDYYQDPDLDLRIIHPDDRKNNSCMYPDPVRFDKPVVSRIIARDGKVVWCEQSNVPIFSETGQLLAIEGIARDISKQKEFEKQLRELNNELIEKRKDLEALNKSLEIRISEEVEKNRSLDHIMAMQARQAAMGEMISSIAHQWRQPLNVLSLAIYDLAEAFEFDELDKKYLENTVDEMNRVIQQMSQTIDDFRNFFKPENEKSHFKFAAVVNTAITFLKPLLESSDIKIVKDTPPDLMVYGYATQLEQVVINLMKNAADALKEYHDGPREISVKLKRIDNGSCSLEVFNTGNHIPEDAFPRLYDPYYTTKPEGQGLGLGLYISRTIIERNMGGTIVCENVESGVKFTVTLEESAANR